MAGMPLGSDSLMAAMRAQFASQAAMGLQPPAPHSFAAPLPRLPSPVPVAPVPVGTMSPAAHAAFLAQQGQQQQQRNIPQLLPSAQKDEEKKLAEEAAARLQKAKEERERKEKEHLEAIERSKCHLHKKQNKACKFCKRHAELVEKANEEKAARREKFINDVRSKASQGSGNSQGMRGPLELANPKTFNISALLHSHIVESTHFKTLLTLEHFEDIVDEIYNFADTVEPYLSNSGTVPSALFCCLTRLFTMALEGHQLRKLLDHELSGYIRCAGFLYVRFGLPPDQLWPWLGEYVLDDEELQTSKDAEAKTTIGEYVEALLKDDKYYNAVLPRVPAATKRQIESKIAEIPQFRKRTQANRRVLDAYRERGVKVEVCLNDGDWHAGEVLELHEGSSYRPKVRVKLNVGGEDYVHIGKVILADSRYSPAAGSRSRRQRSRSRSPGIDWSREKGKTGAELLEELRKREQDRAVCTSGKDYARRPVSFQVALPMDQGSQSHKLAQEETLVESSGRRRDARDRSRSPDLTSRRDKEQSAEYQARMKQLFEKYGMQKATEDPKKKNDIEGPDVMRLG